MLASGSLNEASRPSTQRYSTRTTGRIKIPSRSFLTLQPFGCINPSDKPALSDLHRLRGPANGAHALIGQSVDTVALAPLVNCPNFKRLFDRLTIQDIVHRHSPVASSTRNGKTMICRSIMLLTIGAGHNHRGCNYAVSICMQIVFR